MAPLVFYFFGGPRIQSNDMSLIPHRGYTAARESHRLALRLLEWLVCAWIMGIQVCWCLAHKEELKVLFYRLFHGWARN
jgi:hypothetical protein